MYIFNRYNALTVVYRLTDNMFYMDSRLRSQYMTSLGGSANSKSPVPSCAALSMPYASAYTRLSANQSPYMQDPCPSLHDPTGDLAYGTATVALSSLSGGRMADVSLSAKYAPSFHHQQQLLRGQVRGQGGLGGRRSVPRCSSCSHPDVHDMEG
jgi:hypothetical protein